MSSECSSLRLISSLDFEHESKGVVGVAIFSSFHRN
jgi:hypothetical protein